jgi:hypothetical protein
MENQSSDETHEIQRPPESKAKRPWSWVLAAVLIMLIITIAILVLQTRGGDFNDSQRALDATSGLYQEGADLSAAGKTAEPHSALEDLTTKNQRRADLYASRDLTDTRRIEELVPTGAHLLIHSADYMHVVRDPTGVIWAGSGGQIARLDPATGDTRVWDTRDDEAFGQHLEGLAPAREGGVWMIQADGSLRWFDGERFRDVVEAPPMVADFGDEVNAVVETTYGTLLVSSFESGLFHWDGRSWSQIEDDRPSKGAVALAASSDGDIWVGNFEHLEGPSDREDYVIWRDISHYDGERWETFTSDDAAVLAGDVENIEPLSGGMAWVGTLLGVAYFDGESWRSFDRAEIGFGRGGAVSVSVAPDGTVWAATGSEFGGGISVASFDGEVWSTYSPEDGLPEERGYIDAKPLVTEEGVFVGTEVGLYQLVGDRWSKILSQTEQAASAAAPIRSATRLAGVQGMKASGGFLWAWGGKEIWQYRGDEWSYYAAAPVNSLDDVAYAADTLWAVTNSDLQYFDGNEWQELAGSYLDAGRIEADDKSGILWVLADESLFRWDGEEMSDAGYPPAFCDIVGEIAVTGDGTVWASCWNGYPTLGGLARYNDARGSWEMVRPWRADEDVPALVMVSTPNGGLWVVLADWSEDWEELQAGGEPFVEWALAHRDGASGEWTIFEENLPQGLPWAMAADDEAVWLAQGWMGIGEIDGLIRFDGETWSHYLTGMDVRDIAIAPDGTIWYTTGDDEMLHQLQ